MPAENCEETPQAIDKGLAFTTDFRRYSLSENKQTPLIVFTPIAISLVALSISAVSAYFSYRQTDFQGAAVQIQAKAAELQRTAINLQDFQTRLSKRQLDLAGKQAQLQKALAPPSVEYVRKPSFYIVDAQANDITPVGPAWRHSYPEKAFFKTGIGFTSIKNVLSSYYGVLAVSPSCSTEVKWVDIAFSQTLVTGGLGRSVSSIPKSTHNVVVNPGLSDRLKEFKQRLTKAMQGHCVKEARVYGAFKAEFVGIRSKLHEQYFSGYLMADMSLTTKNEWERLQKASLKRLCQASLSDQAINQCARTILNNLNS